MPKAALRPCRYPGCPELVERGYCAEHADRVSEMRKGSTVRDPEVQRLYNLRRWKRMREAQLRKQPWCEACLSDNIYTPAVHVHHVQRHGGDIAIFLTSPLQSLCHSCHSRITVEETRGKGGEKVSPRGVTSTGGGRREKDSQCEKFRPYRETLT